MGTLSYTATVSLDGYAADADGDFQWSAPDDEAFQFHIDRMAVVSTEVLGRNTYLLMRYWDSEPADGSWGAAEHEFARRWHSIEHVVVSSTLTRDDLASERDRLVPGLGLAELEKIVADAAGEVEIFGPTTASAAIRAGMVRDFRFFVVPKVVGGGLRALPDGAQLDVRLAEHQIFGNGIAYLHYEPR
ncbi:dihydrofolate reductase family protein [Prauserella halophila]|uniref:Dihydrofolate reductase family protein n=1 Tax=Prauserella halophila TaxID=185641 RepID=A0ABP4GW67_9PSEU|nr:dihydrofolate reductase family protein [Prauserella halophila]MCP2236009.1 Dihydrofolate reductase [Prauserella halophila]